MFLIYYRLWGTPPSFGRDSSPGTFSPSLLETGVAAEVEWSVFREGFSPSFEEEMFSLFEKSPLKINAIIMMYFKIRGGFSNW